MRANPLPDDHRQDDDQEQAQPVAVSVSFLRFFHYGDLIRRHELRPLAIFAEDGPAAFVQKVGVDSVVGQVIEFG